ncbi:MAG: hypothetical protein N2Z71_07610 [Caloramator sp.]|nr:hypothetical protein [Caloramator sp.]
MDKFYEQHLGTEKNSLYGVFTILMFFFGFLAVISIFFILTTFMFNIRMIVITVLLALFAYVMMLIRDKQYSEFEYIFTNGNLQIDVIYNKRRRKTLVDIDIKEFEAFGSERDMKLPNGTKKEIFIPWNCKEDRYVFVYNKGGKKVGYIAPDEEMLKLINLYNRGKRI